MRTRALSLSLLLAVSSLGCGPASASASSDAAAPATQEQPAAPSEKKDVAASGDPIETIKKFIDEKKIDTAQKNWKLRLPKPPQLAFDPKKTYYWVMETNKGNLKIKLLPDIAPMHVSSTIYLTTLGYYDGVSFHRVIPGFMAQGGDPTGTGSGGPGYQYAGEFRADVRHDKPGKLSMANAGPGTDGSQFFLTFVATPWLDGKHTLFGDIVEGVETTLRDLEKCGTQGGRPTEPLSIKKATIEVK
jgi:peptidyl-prolyl cis-trans isomerase B (cyclophilin B)